MSLVADINEKLIDSLVNITKDIVGATATRLVLNKAGLESNSSSGWKFLYMIADEIQKIYGQNGGHAILRQIGRELSNYLMSQFREEDWELVMRQAFGDIGFAEGIRSSAEGACICNCVFYPSFLEPNGIEPIQHPVCWGGLGFIEGFAKRLEPDVVEVRWKERDYENKRCIFEYIRGGNGKG